MGEVKQLQTWIGIWSGDWNCGYIAGSNHMVGIMMEMHYLTQPPKRYTFEQPKLKEIVESYCVGLTLNLFAGRVLMDINEVRNDIDPDMPADFHMDAYELVSSGDLPKFDSIILDPPYNLRKAREKYNGRYIGLFTKIKNVLPTICNDGARIITLGYDTVGMSKSRGFKKIAVAVICHNGDHNDTLMVVEEKQ